MEVTARELVVFAQDFGQVPVSAGQALVPCFSSLTAGIALKLYFC